jgi:hypothetical protein
MPSDLHNQLTASLADPLFTSESVQDSVSEINAVGYNIQLNIGATSVRFAYESPADSDQLWELSDDQPLDLDKKVQLDWLLAEDEDDDFLRSIGIRSIQEST